MHDEPGAYFNARKKGRTENKTKCHTQLWEYAKRHRNYKTPNGQRQNYLRGKISNVALDYNIKYKINIHDLLLIQISNLVNKYGKKNS